MAEPTRSPSLPSTADAAPYVPVSWLAAAAATATGLFLVTLLALGWFAFKEKKPLIEVGLLAMPVVALVLCFAARRVVRNSEGTRTEFLYGVNLVNGAWWLALVLGLCYVAYLVAIDYSISKDARAEVTRWTDDIARGDEDGVLGAFWRTLPPGKRRGIAKNDRYALQGQQGLPLVMFSNCDLVRLAQRNRGAFEFATGAVTWAYKPGAIDGVVTGTVTCPEGKFPVIIPVRGEEGVAGADGGVGRQWSIVQPGSGGFVNQSAATRTPYGWLVVVLEIDGGAFGKGFVSHLGAGPGGHAYAYRAFVAPGGDRPGWGAVALDPLAQLAFAGPAGAVAALAGGPPDAGYADYLANHFYKLPGGGEPSPEQKKAFATSWNAQGVRPAGEKLKDQSGGPLDKDDIIAVTDTAVEVRVPVEIPILNVGKVAVARGRVVVACTDPALVAELKQLKGSANPNLGTDTPTDEQARRKFPWRVVRIESDLVPVSIGGGRPEGAPGAPPGGPGGPGGMTGG